MDLHNFIQTFAIAIRTQDPRGLRYCLTIMPGSDGPLRTTFPEPGEFDLYPLPEKYHAVLKAHLRLMKSIHGQKDLEKSFTELNCMVNHLLRAVDAETNWINEPLIGSLNELIAMYKMKEARNPNAQLDFDSDNEEEGAFAQRNISSLEELANTLNRAFKLSLNDKNVSFAESKRVDIYFFLGTLIKVYFKMNNLELAKSIEKVVKGTRLEFPSMVSGSPLVKKSSVVYLYYTALLAIDDGSYAEAEEKLLAAIEVLRYYNVKVNAQTQRILFLLLPLRLHTSRLAPKRNNAIWNNYPQLAQIYRDGLFRAISHGDLNRFNAILEKHKVMFLKSHLYIVVELLRRHVYVNLVKKTTALTMEQGGNHIVSLHAYQIALKESGEEMSLDGIECLLANLIYEGRIKGYLSHANRCVVLSKTEAFPR